MTEPRVRYVPAVVNEEGQGVALDMGELLKIHRMLGEETGQPTPMELLQLYMKNLHEKGMSYREIARHLDEVSSPELVPSEDGFKEVAHKTSRSRVMHLVKEEIKKRGKPASTLSKQNYDRIKKVLAQVKDMPPRKYVNSQEWTMAEKWTVRSLARFVSQETGLKIQEAEMQRIIYKMKDEHLRFKLRALLAWAKTQKSQPRRISTD